MSDEFDSHSSGINSPIRNAAAVTPDDDADLEVTSRALHLGVGGDVKVTMKGGAVVTFSAMAAGWHPVRVSRVWATGTTATGIVAGW